jgi:hypothetical protein
MLLLPAREHKLVEIAHVEQPLWLILRPEMQQLCSPPNRAP